MLICLGAEVQILAYIFQLLMGFFLDNHMVSVCESYQYQSKYIINQHLITTRWQNQLTKLSSFIITEVIP